MNTKGIFFGVKAAGAWRWHLCQHHEPIAWESWEPQPPGNLGAYLGLYRDSFILFTFLIPCIFNAEMHSLCLSSGRFLVVSRQGTRSIKSRRRLTARRLYAHGQAVLRHQAENHITGVATKSLTSGWIYIYIYIYVCVCVCEEMKYIST